jgi:hypothetical protein
LSALEDLGTGPGKAFLETAPCLIAVFAQRYSQDAHGEKVQHYYVNRSVGIATGFLIAALHTAGLALLPYTPSPMGFLSDILGRPDSERPFLILVTGYPAPGIQVPGIQKKPLEEIATFI